MRGYWTGKLIEPPELRSKLTARYLREGLSLALITPPLASMPLVSTRRASTEQYHLARLRLAREPELAPGADGRGSLRVPVGEGCGRQGSRPSAETEVIENQTPGW